MMEKTAKSKSGAGSRKASASQESIESLMIGLRIHNDGGPLFESLTAIRSAHIRCDRVRQLLYLGLMREKELLRPSAPVMLNAALMPASPTANQPVAVPVAANAATKEVEPQVKFNANDLNEWFGG